MASAQGFAQEPGRSHRLREGQAPEGPPATKGPGSRATGVRHPWERSMGHPHRYRGCEGNEAAREGRWEVGALQWYRGSGGTDPRDPVEGRGVPGYGIAGGK